MRPDLFPITFEGKLDRFIEECAEATQAICKLRRFGKKPTDPKTRIKYDNIHDMLMEMGQVEHAIGEVRQHLEANMQQGGDVGGLADRAQMPEFQHSYPYLAFARKHNLDYGLVLARVDVWRRSPKTQDMIPLESKAVAFFGCYIHKELYHELYRIWGDTQNATRITAKI